MQREIKCRGKLKADGKTWIVGAYYKHQKVTLCPIGLTEQDIKDNEIHLIFKGGFSDWNLPAPIKCYEVIPETVGLYTGITAKYCNELCEGDIYRREDADELYVVVWNGTGFIGKSLHMDGCYDNLQSPESILLVGNITDNPELLES